MNFLRLTMMCLFTVIHFAASASFSKEPPSCKSKADKSLAKFEEIRQKALLVEAPCAGFESDMQVVNYQVQSCIQRINQTDRACDKNSGKIEKFAELENTNGSGLVAARNSNNGLFRQYTSLKDKLDNCAQNIKTTISECTDTFKQILSWEGRCPIEETERLLGAIESVSKEANAIDKICGAFENLYAGRKQQIAYSKSMKQSRQVYTEIKE